MRRMWSGRLRVIKYTPGIWLYRYSIWGKGDPAGSWTQAVKLAKVRTPQISEACPWWLAELPGPACGLHIKVVLKLSPEALSFQNRVEAAFIWTFDARGRGQEQTVKAKQTILFWAQLRFGHRVTWLAQQWGKGWSRLCGLGPLSGAGTVMSTTATLAWNTSNTNLPMLLSLPWLDYYNIIWGVASIYDVPFVCLQFQANVVSTKKCSWTFGMKVCLWNYTICWKKFPSEYLSHWQF